jgi:hypothetical protein
MTKTIVATLCLALVALLTGCGRTPMTPKTDSASSSIGVSASLPSGASNLERPQVFAGACDIRNVVAAYQGALGTLNPNQPGSFGSGRREINWDAVPAQFTNIDQFPADFFNGAATGRARGAVFTTPGTGFRVSDNNFKDVNPTYPDQFNFFSPIKTFIAVGDPVSGVNFFVPGTSTPATTNGFGVVFSDVDHLGSAMLRCFDASGRSLGTYLAPACPEGFSFVGVRFAESIVARVEIVSGHKALGADSFDISTARDGPSQDLVIMDDFIYGEPIAIGAGDASPAGPPIQ